VFEVLRSLGLRKMHNRLNGCDNVPCSVFGFPSQRGDFPFALLAIGDVLEAVHRTDNVPAFILKSADVNEHNTTGAVGTFDHDFPVLHRITASENLAHWAIGMVYWAAVEVVHAV